MPSTIEFVSSSRAVEVPQKQKHWLLRGAVVPNGDPQSISIRTVPFRIGRSTENSLFIPSTVVSSRHAEIIETAGEKQAYEEGCLSVPGIFDKLTTRSARVVVRALGRNGKPFELEAEGLLAICIQHEMDHLNGVLFVDRVTDELSLHEGLKEKGFNRADVQTIR